MGGEMSTMCGAQRKPDPVEWPQFEEKMKQEGLSDAAIAAFKHNYFKLASGADLMMLPADIVLVEDPAFKAIVEE